MSRDRSRASPLFIKLACSTHADFWPPGHPVILGKVYKARRHRLVSKNRCGISCRANPPIHRLQRQRLLCPPTKVPRLQTGISRGSLRKLRQRLSRPLIRRIGLGSEATLDRLHTRWSLASEAPPGARGLRSGISCRANQPRVPPLLAGRNFHTTRTIHVAAFWPTGHPVILALVDH